MPPPLPVFSSPPAATKEALPRKAKAMGVGTPCASVLTGWPVTEVGGGGPAADAAAGTTQASATAPTRMRRNVERVIGSSVLGDRNRPRSLATAASRG